MRLSLLGRSGLIVTYIEMEKSWTLALKRHIFTLEKSPCAATKTQHNQNNNKQYKHFLVLSQLNLAPQQWQHIYFLITTVGTYSYSLLLEEKNPGGTWFHVLGQEKSGWAWNIMFCQKARMPSKRLETELKGKQLALKSLPLWKEPQEQHMLLLMQLGQAESRKTIQFRTPPKKQQHKLHKRSL